MLGVGTRARPHQPLSSRILTEPWALMIQANLQRFDDHGQQLVEVLGNVFAGDLRQFTERGQDAGRNACAGIAQLGQEHCRHPSASPRLC